MKDSVSNLLRRRSVAARWLGEPGPTTDEIDTLLTIAARVPDHGRLTPWRFILIRGEGRHRLGDIQAAAFKDDNPDAAPDKIETERSRFAHAPLVVAVVSSVKPSPKIPKSEQVLSAGAVCMNLLHAAKALGYGAVWLSGWSSFDRRVLDALGLAPHERIAGYIHIGTSTELPTERPRPVLAEIVSEF